MMRRVVESTVAVCLFVFGVAGVMPRGNAQQQETGELIEMEGQYDLETAAKMLAEDPNVGLVFKALFNKKFKTQFIGPGTVTSYEPGSEPPITDPDKKEVTLTFTVYEGSKCIRCTHGGQVIEICR